MKEKWPSFYRTEKALAEYRRIDAEFSHMVDFGQFCTSDLEKELNRVEAAAEAVGLAFGQDTADRNNIEDCRRHIRPCAFVDRCISEWRKQLRNEKN